VGSFTVARKDPLQPDRCAELLGALAAPERLRIVRYLLEGEHTVTEIAVMLKTPIVNVSHHLQVLKTAGLIRGRKDGRYVRYALSAGVLNEAFKAGLPCDALNLGCCQIMLPASDLKHLNDD
jgi:DNA-binding transcriptional ArsR family regulator